MNNQCVVYIFKCDLCDADDIGYSTRHLHQRTEERKFAAVGKHLKEDHGVKTSSSELTNMFSILRECQGKLDCLIHEMLFICEMRPKLNTNQAQFARKFIFSILLHTQLLTPLQTLSLRTV